MDEINWNLIALALSSHIRGLEHMIDKYTTDEQSDYVDGLKYKAESMKEEYRKVLIKQQESNKE